MCEAFSCTPVDNFSPSSAFRATGSAADRPRPSQPRVTTRRQDNFKRQRHLRDRFTTAVSMASLIQGRRRRSIHARTVIRRLREYGIRYRRPYRGQILTQRHRQNRLRWAPDMINNRHQNWNQVVFSDESRFSLSFADGRVRLYRRQHERYRDACVAERDWRRQCNGFGSH